LAQKVQRGSDIAIKGPRSLNPRICRRRRKTFSVAGAANAVFSMQVMRILAERLRIANQMTVPIKDIWSLCGATDQVVVCELAQ
jgi:hypothetical protein